MNKLVCPFPCLVSLLADSSGISDLLLSAAPVESHVGAVVDSPNACVTLALPLGIFEHVRCLTSSAYLAHVYSQDILPKEEGLTKKDFGQCAIRSDGII